jgi:hypothetical protein
MGNHDDGGSRARSTRLRPALSVDIAFQSYTAGRSLLSDFPRRRVEPEAAKLASTHEPSSGPRSIGLAGELVSDRVTEIVERRRSNAKIGHRHTAE